VNRARRSLGLGTACFLAALHAASAEGPDPRTRTEKILSTLEASSDAKRLAKDPIDKAKDALVRARSARVGKDQVHGAELEVLASIWAELAQDLVRAAEVEQKLIDVQKQSAELDMKALRARALTEQTVARRGRAEQKLAAIDENGALAAPAASAVKTKSAPPPSSNEPRRPPLLKPKAGPEKR
jgi:hypothetical protein